MSGQIACASATAATRRRRDIALLERHWAWLSDQSRSTSATLRLLVEEASRDPYGKYQAQKRKEACYFLMRDQAGDRPLFEEACRALFSDDLQALQALVAQWPSALANQVMALATEACAGHAPIADARQR